MKRFLVITLLLIAAWCLALGQTPSKKAHKGNKDQQETKRPVDKSDKAVASASPTQSRALPPPEDVAKARLGDGLTEPDSPPKPGDNDVSFTPPMFGDFKIPGTIDRTSGPIAPARGAYKITENESPRPQNRVFINYNYYNEIRLPREQVNSHREHIGFEKTFLDGRASIGLRQPFFQIRGANGFRDSEADNLSVIVKYAPILNRDTGSVLSTGIVVTLPRPNSSIQITKDGETKDIHSTLLQPFLGYIWSRNKFFVQGFSSIMVPTDSDDLTLLFNSIGIGYRVYLSRGEQSLTSIIPTFEVHVNDPLNHRDRVGAEKVRDSVDLTGGFSFVFNRKYSFGIGLVTPVTHPRTFRFEPITRFNYQF